MDWFERTEQEGPPAPTPAAPAPPDQGTSFAGRWPSAPGSNWFTRMESEGPSAGPVLTATPGSAPSWSDWLTRPDPAVLARMDELAKRERGGRPGALAGVPDYGDMADRFAYGVGQSLASVPVGAAHLFPNRVHVPPALDTLVFGPSATPEQTAGRIAGGLYASGKVFRPYNWLWRHYPAQMGAAHLMGAGRLMPDWFEKIAHLFGH